MSLQLLIDMNLSPDWEPWFKANGIDARHWSQVGNHRASDTEIMDWARVHACVILTHDLDFGTILALTRSRGPSVVQLRTQDILPDRSGQLVLNVIRQFQSQFVRGALVTVDAANARVRVLPVRP
jgi:predicted nuclease of predicted toxin-antitoxin system